MVKITLSVLGLAIAGGVFFVYTQPTYDNLRKLEGEINGFNQALEKAAELQQLKQSLLSRYNAFSPEDLDRVHKLLPDHVDNVRLVLDLDSLAARHGMALQNVVVSNPVSESGRSGVVGAIGAGQQKYDSLTLKFSTQGTYENFTSFLQDLESSLRIVDLISISINQLTAPELKGDPTYKYDIVIRTYWLK